MPAPAPAKEKPTMKTESEKQHEVMRSLIMKGKIVGGFIGPSLGVDWSPLLPKGIKKEMVVTLKNAYGYEWRLKSGYADDPEIAERLSREEEGWMGVGE